MMKTGKILHRRYRVVQVVRLVQHVSALGRYEEAFVWLRREGITARRLEKLLRSQWPYDDFPTVRELSAVHAVAGWCGVPQTGLGIIE